MEFDIENLDIKINCHSSIRINGNIYVDPFEITSPRHDAKYIFITHSHYDHFDLKSILNLMNNCTQIITIRDVANRLKDYVDSRQITVVSNDSENEIGNIKYSTFPAYNSHHLKIMGYVGFNIEVDGIKYTICGDTDATEELGQITTDVLFIPIGGTYTMDALHAADMVNRIKPKLVIPTHYNYIEGTGNKQDEALFVEYVNRDIPIKILI